MNAIKFASIFNGVFITPLLDDVLYLRFLAEEGYLPPATIWMIFMGELVPVPLMDGEGVLDR